MDAKNRIYITLAVIFIIVGATLTSFVRSMIGIKTTAVILPAAGDEAASTAYAHTGTGYFQRVEVTPDTVQAVIATLSRSTSYFRELTVETFWVGGTSLLPVQAWVEGDWSLTRKALPSGMIRHELVGEDTLYYWDEGSRTYRTAPADVTAGDLSQHLPTYETVLALDKKQITQADYRNYGEFPCVYVEFTQGARAYVQQFWVSVDTGLLVAAEIYDDEQLIYRMSAASPITTPCPPEVRFALPDGTMPSALTDQQP